MKKKQKVNAAILPFWGTKDDVSIYRDVNLIV
jgi:hypothetical protein